VHNPNSWIDPTGLMAMSTDVDFTGHPDLFQHENSVVKIKMQGSRKRDFTEAYRESGIDRKLADGYTWHHVHDFDPATGETTMQLVKRPTHEATYPHKGSVAQFESEHGVKYDTKDAVDVAREKGWIKCK